MRFFVVLPWWVLVLIGPLWAVLVGSWLALKYLGLGLYWTVRLTARGLAATARWAARAEVPERPTPAGWGGVTGALWLAWYTYLAASHARALNAELVTVPGCERYAL